MHRQAFTSSQLAQIEKGKTTRAEVIAILGTPKNVSITDGPEGKQTVLIYQTTYISKKNEANAWLGIMANSDPYSAGAKPDVQIVNIYIGTNDVVQSVSTTQGGEPPGPRSSKPPVQKAP